MKPICVLIVDDHPVVRKGLELLLEIEPGLTIVGEANDANSAIQLNKQLQPHIILMDLMLPGKNGIEAIAQIKSDNPNVKVIVLTSFEDKEMILAVMDTGIDGYLLKNAEGEALLQAIRAVQKGDMPLDPRVTRYLLEFGQNANSPNGLHLTERERQTLELITQGLSNKDVAYQLSITEGTVKSYVRQIFGKLGVSTRTEAAMWATRSGLISGSNNQK